MTFEQFKEKYGLRLTETQAEAVQSVEGPVLLLAVPGSGKTTVLVSRLGYMILGLGISPSSVLTMTYTVAATKDMKDRFCSFFGEEWRGAVEFRTINGVCAKIIRAYERHTGRKAFRLVSDEKESAAIIASVWREALDLSPTEQDIGNTRTQITYIKNMMLSDEAIAEFDQKSPYSIEKLYRRYCEAMREGKAMDYDDQLLYAYRILRKYPQILNEIQDQFRYICVDEAQDTSRIQHEIIALLAEKQGNLFMVGDEDQSIYGFRAAYPEALLGFAQRHEGAKILFMEENFRSDGKIVKAADRFIRRNPRRYEKNMRAFHPGKRAASEIRFLFRKNQYAYLFRVALLQKEQTAVLYRNNESALPLLDLLDRSGASYRLRMTHPRFFTDRVVLDILSVIRLVYDPTDTEAFRRVYHKLATELTPMEAERICEISEKRGISVWDAARQTELFDHAEKRCRRIAFQMRRVKWDRADRAISRITYQMGYILYLFNARISGDKLDTLSLIGRNEPSLLHLARRLQALEELILSGKSDENASFVLSSVHSSKGLEYDTVYLIDAFDRKFPEMPMDNPWLATAEELAQYEEERRLFYVAATRAKKRLYLLTYFGESCRFCNEFLGKRYMKIFERRLRDAVSPEYLSFRAEFVKGMPFTHKIWGAGTVLGNGECYLDVRFESGKHKRFLFGALFEEARRDRKTVPGAVWKSLR